MFIDFTKQKIRTVVSAVSIGLISFGGYAQEKAILQVKKETNSQGLSSLHSQFKRESEAAKKRVEEYLKKQRSLRSEGAQESIKDCSSELIDVRPDGSPIYYTNYNDEAARTTRTDKLHAASGLGYNLTGEGEVIGMWEGTTADSNHEVFTGRAFSKESYASDSYNLKWHANHVGGTLVGAKHAAGGRAAGMAPNATLLSYDWNSDREEIVQAVDEHNLLISNHSYGQCVNTVLEFEFGKYSYLSMKMDEIANQAPYYLHVKAAANDRTGFISSGCSDYGPVKHKDYLAKGGYDLLHGPNIAKNTLTVAAVKGVQNYVNASSVEMTNFSNWGPTDDGRVKPDISAQGVDVYSADAGSNNGYRYSNGTSMAAPNVSGSLLLLQQYYKRLNGFYMRAATLKGLALHTASEAGRNPGPDYEFGWGLLNAEKAAETIKNNGESSLIKEEILDNNEVYTFKVRKNSTNEPLIVSISWNDAAYTDLNTIVDNPTPVLVNDLDVRITDSENNVSFPWKLNPANPASGATKGDNIVDNIEKIEVVGGAAGEVYTVTITHKGVLAGNQQAVSVVVTGGSRVSGACNLAQWSRSKAYKKGDIVEYLGDRFEAKFWSQGSVPFSNDQWGAWEHVASCDDLGGEAPVITLLSPTETSEFRGKNKIEFTAKVTDIDLISVVLRRTNENGTEIINPVKVNNDIYIFEYIPDWYGEYQNTFVAIDSKGNKRTRELNFFLYEKEVNPELSFSNLTEGTVLADEVLFNIDIEAIGIYGKNKTVVLTIQKEGTLDIVKELSLVPGQQTVYGFEYNVPNVDKNENITLKAQIRDENGSVVVEKVVNALIRNNVAPYIELLSYKDKLFSPSETVEIKVKAVDIDGSIDKVIFITTDGNNALIEREMIKKGEIYTLPFTVSNSPSFKMNEIIAFDNNGRQSEVTTIVTRVGNKTNNPPVVDIHQIEEGSMYELDNSVIEIPFVYTAANIDDGPEYVVSSEIYLNNQLIRTDIHQESIGLFNHGVLQVSEFGAYTIKVRSLDERGAWGEAEVSFEVVKNPEIRFTNLTEGSLYTLNKGELLDVNVEVIKGSSDIQLVEYYTYEYNDINFFPRVEVYTSTEAPYSFQYDPKRGSSEIYITATVVDMNGKTNSASVSIYTEKDKIQPPYPNPTTGIVNIPWDVALGKAIVSVYSSRNIEQFSKTFEGGNEFQINLSSLNKGVYFVLVESEDGFYFKEHKVILE